MKHLAVLVVLLVCSLTFSGCVGVDATRTRGEWHIKPHHVWDDWGPEGSLNEDLQNDMDRTARENRAAYATVRAARSSAEAVRSTSR